MVCLKPVSTALLNSINILSLTLDWIIVHMRHNIDTENMFVTERNTYFALSYNMQTP